MAKKKDRVHYRKGAEIDGLREAGHTAAEILRLTGELVKAGVTTREVDEAAADFIADRKCISAFLGYKGFPGNICISVNDQVVHGIGGDRVIEEGDAVSIDVGIYTPDRWVGDNAKTVPVGTITEEAKALLYATEESLDCAISLAVDGGRLSDLCASVEACVVQYGFSVVKEFVGHGLGRELHEAPQVPNYWDAEEMRRNRARDYRLKPGMALAIEPMVNFGTPQVIILDDKWTVETADHQLSAHFEHTVLITEEGPEVLTPRERLFPTPPAILEKLAARSV